MTTKTPEERLAALGLTLPAVPTPMADYVPYRLAGNFLYLSGQGPKRADASFMVGRLGKDASVEQGYEAARITGLQLLAVARAALGELSRVEAVVKLLGMVNAEPTSEIIPRSSTAAPTSWSRCLATSGAMRVLPLAWVRCRMASWSKSRPFCRSELKLRATPRKSGPMIYEICVNSVAGVRAAKDAGARLASSSAPTSWKAASRRASG